MTSEVQVARGDIVQIKRGWDTHWGICVGNNEMVHLAPNIISNGREQSALVLGSLTGDETARVVKSKISVVAGENDYCAFNYLDDKLQPKPIKDIVSFALEQTERCTWGYSLVLSNGEKFALWCRYRNDGMGGRSPSWIVLMILRLMILLKIITAVFGSILLMLILILNKIELAHDNASQGTVGTLALLNMLGVTPVPYILRGVPLTVASSMGTAWSSFIAYMAMYNSVGTASLLTIIAMGIAAPVMVGHLVIWNLRGSTCTLSWRSVTTLSPSRSIQTSLVTTTSLIIGVTFGLLATPWLGVVFSSSIGVLLSAAIGSFLWVEPRASKALVIGTALGTIIGLAIGFNVWHIEWCQGVSKQLFPPRHKEAIAVGITIGTIIEVCVWATACCVAQDTAQFT